MATQQTYAELIALIRRDFLDDVADTPDMPEEDYAWPTDFLLQSFFEAERQVCKRKQDMLYDETTAAIVNPTIVASTRTMEIDPRIIDISWMMIGDERRAVKTTRERLDQDEPAWRTQEEEDYPTHFFVYNNTIYWNRLPSATCAAETCTMGVWRYPLGEGDLEDAPEVPEPRDLIHWVLYEAFSKADAGTGETFNEKRAEKHFGLFNAAFGMPRSNEALAAQKEGTRDFSMVPPSYFGNMTRRGRRL